MPKKSIGLIIFRVLIFLAIIIVLAWLFLVCMIFVPVSSQQTVVIPDVREMSLIKAKVILSKSKLSCSEVFITHSYQKNWVINQKPPAGQRVKIGRKIELIVSNGAKVEGKKGGI